MGNTNSSQVYDPQPVRQSQHPCRNLDQVDQSTDKSEVRTEISANDQTDTYFEDEFSGFEDLEDEGAVYPPSQRPSVLVPNKDLYHHFAATPSVEMQDVVPDASSSTSIRSAEEREDHSTILDTATRMNEWASIRSTNLHWHEPGCDGLRGHSTPVESPAPSIVSWSFEREDSTAEDSERSLPSQGSRSPSGASSSDHRYSTSRERTPLSPIRSLPAASEPPQSPVSDSPAASEPSPSPIRGSPASSEPPRSPTRSPPAVREPSPARTVPAPELALLQQNGSKSNVALHDSDRSSGAVVFGGSSSTDWRAKYAKFPDPEKDISRPLRYYHKIHKKAEAARPRQKLPQHRYWIAVIPQVDHSRPNIASKHFFLKAHRKTTVETVRRIYAVATASDDVHLLLGQERVEDAECMEELDICNTKLIVFRCVRSAELMTLAKQHSEGLVLPEMTSSPAADTQPIVILDD